MKINPIGIQSYQQLERRDAPAQAPPDGKKVSAGDSKVTISPQAADAGSRVTVKAPQSSYAEILTPEEKQALELLFRRFGDASRFGPGYQRDAESTGAQTLVGSIVDVKV
jgi:hypothetical protein